MNFLERCTSPAFRAQYEKIRAQDPSVETLSYMLGPHRILEWAHSVGVATNDDLKKVAPPIPPYSLRSIVAASSEALFLWTGIADASKFMSTYLRHAGSKPDNARILDFGCGCGRMTRFFGQVPEIDISGTDINAATVAWCQENLRGVKTVSNRERPPLDYDDGSFDMVYSLSIFTHLPEGASKAWLTEIGRVLAPGGVAILSTHGYPAINIIVDSETHQGMFRLRKADAERMRDDLEIKGFQYIRCDPKTLAVAKAGDDYGHSFAHERYIHEEWPKASGMEVVEFIPGGVRGWQDMVVLRKRA